MMKNRFFKFIRVYWKGILLYALAAGLITFLILFLYFGGTSFFGMEGFYRKNLMANMGMYLAMFLVVSVIQAVLFFIFPNVFHDGRWYVQNA